MTREEFLKKYGSGSANTGNRTGERTGGRMSRQEFMAKYGSGNSTAQSSAGSHEELMATVAELTGGNTAAGESRESPPGEKEKLSAASRFNKTDVLRAANDTQGAMLNELFPQVVKQARQKAEADREERRQKKEEGVLYGYTPEEKAVIEGTAPQYTAAELLQAANDTSGAQYKELRRQAQIRGAETEAVRQFEQDRTDAELLDFYADPSVKLNDAQMQTAKRLVREFEAKYPKTRDYDPINGMDPQAGYQMAAMMRDPQYQSYIQLLNKTDAFEAGLTNFTEGTGAGQILNLLGRIGADDEDRAEMDEWKDARGAVRASGQAQHPIASTVGYMGGKMVEYLGGKIAMGALPGVGGALDWAGNAISKGLSGAGKVGAAAAQLLPGERIAGLMGDQILDVLFDTAPQVAEDVQQMQRQQREGLADGEKEITPGSIALGAAGNFGSNVLFNLLGEAGGIAKDAKGIPGAIQMSRARQAVASGAAPSADQLLEFNQGAARGGLEGSQEWLDTNMAQYKNGLAGGASVKNTAQVAEPDLYFEMGENGPVLRSRALDAEQELFNGIAEDLKITIQNHQSNLGHVDRQAVEEIAALDELALRNATEGKPALRFEDAVVSAEQIHQLTPIKQKELTSGIREALGDHVEVIDPGEKSIASLAKKIMRKVNQEGRADYDIFTPKDHTRTAVLLNSLEDVPNAVAALKQKFPGLTGEVFIDEPLNSSGYRGIHLTADLGDGIKGEIQISTPEAWAIKKQSDAIYDKWRNFDEFTLTDAQAAERAADYTKSMEMWEEYYNSFTPEVRRMASSSVMGLESSQVPNTPLKGTQAPSINSFTRNSESGYARSREVPSTMPYRVSTSTPPSDAVISGNSIPQIKEVNKAGSEPEIPKGMKERGYAKSIRTKTDLPGEVQQEFIDNPEIYKELANATTLAKAEAVMSQGLEAAQNSYRRMLSQNDPAAIPLGRLLADEMISAGNRDGAVEILREMSQRLTKSGQFSQAAAITLLKEDPMTALQYITRQLDDLNAEGAKKFKHKWKDFELTEAEVKAFGELQSGDREGIKELFEQVGARVRKEYPAGRLEKLVEASHIAMLLNPRTMVRNTLANVGMLPMQKVSQKISALGQNAYKMLDGNYKPTQALHIDPESRDVARQVFEQVRENIGSSAAGKWENTLLRGAADKEMFKVHGEKSLFEGSPILEQLFGGAKKGLNTLSAKTTGAELFDALSSEKSVAENLRQLTYGLLELGDEGFVRQNFVDRLASYLSAQGIKSLDDVPPEAIEIATAEALKATFKDDNWMTRLVSGIKKNTGIVGELAMPFTKTPANLTVRALDYSPVGIAKGITSWVKNGGNPSAYIDDIAKGLTGTGTILLGALLYKAGVMTGPLSDNKREAAFQRQQGQLPYAVKVGNDYYTYDWIQPAATGLVLGTTIASEIEKNGGFDAMSIAQAVKKTVAAFGDTLLEQSTLQNVRDILGGYGSPTENLINEAAEMPQRLIPAASGALARTLDPVQRQTFSNGNILDTLFDTAASKIPGLSQRLPAAYDTWGNEIRRSDSVGEAAAAQMLSPGQMGNAAVTPLDSYIQQLFEETGDESVFPRKADWSITVDALVNEETGETEKQNLKLTNDQYSDYQREMGAMSYDIAEQLIPLIKSSDAELSGDQQAYALDSAYSIANELAKAMLFKDTPNKETQGILEDAQALDGNASYESIANLLFAKAVVKDIHGDKYPNGKTIPGSAKRKKIDALVEAGFTREEAMKIYRELE